MPNHRPCDRLFENFSSQWLLPSGQSSSESQDSEAILDRHPVNTAGGRRNELNSTMKLRGSTACERHVDKPLVSSQPLTSRNSNHSRHLPHSSGQHLPGPYQGAWFLLSIDDSSQDLACRRDRLPSGKPPRQALSTDGSVRKSTWASKGTHVPWLPSPQSDDLRFLSSPTFGIFLRGRILTKALNVTTALPRSALNERTLARRT